MGAPGASLGHALGIRSGEGARVVAMAGLFALLEAGRALGEVGVETLVQGRFGPLGLMTVLPFLYMGLGALGLVAALVYGAALGRVARRPLFVGVLGLAAALMTLGWAGLAGGSDAVLLGLWLTVSLVGTLLMTIYWTLAGSAFDVRQARRLFPLLTAAAIAGGFVGSLAAGPLTGLIGAADLVVLEAAALIVAMPLVATLVRRARQVPAAVRRRSVMGEVRNGMDTVRRSPLLRRIAAAYVLLAVLMFSIQFPFTVSVAATFPTDTERATALGTLSAIVTATSFLVSAFVAGRIYQRFGVSAGAVMLPVVYLIGFGVWLVSFSFQTAAAVRLVQQVTQRGVSNASWSAFYNVVPAERRAQVIAFNDGVPAQLGTILSGALLLAAGRALTPDIVFWLGAVTAFVTTALVVGIRRGYGRSLVDGLRGGSGERLLEGGPGIEGLLHDPSVGVALASALEAPEPGVREVAARLLGESRRVDDHAYRGLVASTRDPDARVRVAAIGALARAGPLGARDADASEAGQPRGIDLAALASDPDARVRAAAIVAGVREEPAAVLALVSDEVASVRATALGALAPTGGAPLSAEARAAAVHALDDPAGRVRAAAASTLGADDRSPADLLELLEQGPPRATMAALEALTALTARTGQDPAMRTPVAAYADRQLGRVTELRAARHLVAGGDDPAFGFLVQVLMVREQTAIRSLLGALAVLGAPEASGLVRRCLSSHDQDTRAQAVEALESLGDRRLARRIAGLLDEEPRRGSSDAIQRDTALASLGHDVDPWLRRLAQACRGEPAVAEATRSLTELQTMLALRRVPLFEGLEPEDLQRVAAFAEERSYLPGEVLMTQGEATDELVVLLAGRVRVERAEADGTTRFIRTYDAGEHIGELAVLRERPRAATVTADSDGARGLVVPGVGLRGILRERPEAAMAMLATLAERLSRQ